MDTPLLPTQLKHAAPKTEAYVRTRLVNSEQNTVVGTQLALSDYDAEDFNSEEIAASLHVNIQKGMKTRSYLLLLFTLIGLVVAVAITTVACVVETSKGSKDFESLVKNGTSSNWFINQMATQGEPTNAQFTSFSNREELVEALDGETYFDQHSIISKKYGFPIGTWNVSAVSDFSSLFQERATFNEDIGSWDVSRATQMSRMFKGASAFNQPIGDWDVSNVRDMTRMFQNSLTFNQSIAHWDVSNVSTMKLMFYSASAFSQDISHWNVSNVVDMRGMFIYADTFNQDISKWKIGKVEDMRYMFQFATSFNQNLCTWGETMSSSTDVRLMFLSTACPETGDPHFDSNPVTPICHRC